MTRVLSLALFLTVKSDICSHRLPCAFIDDSHEIRFDESYRPFDVADDVNYHAHPLVQLHVCICLFVIGLLRPFSFRGSAVFTSKLAIWESAVIFVVCQFFILWRITTFFLALVLWLMIVNNFNQIIKIHFLRYEFWVGDIMDRKKVYRSGHFVSIMKYVLLRTQSPKSNNCHLASIIQVCWWNPSTTVFSCSWLCCTRRF